MGMLIGATFMSPYADRIGRKPMIIMGLLLSGIGMICAGMSVDVKWLFAGRLITGIGVGAIIASINTLACLLYTSPSPRDATLSRMPSSA